MRSRQGRACCVWPTVLHWPAIDAAQTGPMRRSSNLAGAATVSIAQVRKRTSGPLRLCGTKELKTRIDQIP